MSKPETITFAHVVKLLDVKSIYLVGYSVVYGMSVWQTFFAGFIALKALPREHFRSLQHRTFPIYFLMSIGLSSVLLGLWVHLHPSVKSNFTNIFQTDVIQAYALANSGIMQAVNRFVVGPMTSSVMWKRSKLEKEEGKEYSDPGASKEMKALTKTFMQLHGWSSLLNLGSVISLLFHGLWIGHYGL